MSVMARSRALAELRALARQVETVGVANIRTHGSNHLYRSLLHHFGSIAEARIAAKVGGPRQPHPGARISWPGAIGLGSRDAAYPTG